MTALIILLSISLLFLFILMIKLTVVIDYSDELSLNVIIMGIIKVNIVPKRTKKIHLGKYTAKKVARRNETERKKRLKKAERQKRKREEKAEKKKRSKNEIRAEKNKKPTLTENLIMIGEILQLFLSRTFGHLKIKVSHLNIVIGTEDPAKTAILYGAVCQAVLPIAAFLEKYTKIGDLDKTDINIVPDFLSEKTTVDIRIKFSLKVWHLLHIGLGALRKFLKNNIRAARRAAKASVNSNMKAASHKNKVQAKAHKSGKKRYIDAANSK